MNPDRKTIDSTVLLPNARSFRARAAMAVMTSTTTRSYPERLLLQLPPMGINDAERLLLEYAAEWGFPADAVTECRDRADQRESTDRDYSTHVFTADAVGFVTLEFQASHHVRAGYAILSTLLSWHADGRANH
jgi:hypothetical protein